MAEGDRLSATIISKNEAARIEACIAALSFCGEVLVVDSGSTDETQALARAAGARVIERAFISCNDQKDFARSQAKNPWVLNIDADEVVSPELAQEVLRATAGPAGFAGYTIPFRNRFRGVWVRSCGYFPDRHLRLVLRDKARWVDTSIHDRVVLDGPVGALQGAIDHYSFDSIDDFLEKSRRYSSDFARRAHESGRRAGFWSVLIRPAWRFFRAFVLQGGFREGTLGLLIASLQAYEVFQKYARLWERTRFL